MSSTLLTRNRPNTLHIPCFQLSYVEPFYNLPLNYIQKHRIVKQLPLLSYFFYTFTRGVLLRHPFHAKVVIGQVKKPVHITIISYDRKRFKVKLLCELDSAVLNYKTVMIIRIAYFAQKLTLEIQRRSGDAILFHQIAKNIINLFELYLNGYIYKHSPYV